MPYYNYNLVSENDIVVSGVNPYLFEWRGITTVVTIDDDKIYYGINARPFNNLDKHIILKLKSITPNKSYNIAPTDIVFYFDKASAAPYPIDTNENLYSFDSADDHHVVSIEYILRENITIAKLDIARTYNFSKDHNEIMASYASIISRIECDCIYIVGKSYGKLLDDYYAGIGYSWKSKEYHKPSNKIICRLCSGESYPKLRPL